MKIKSSLSQNKWDDWRYDYTLEIDGKVEFDVYDGEPEDNSLMRNFNDCVKIPDLLKRAYEAGKNGEEFELEVHNADL